VSRGDLLLQITRAVVSLAGLAGITYLAGHDKVDPAATVAIYSTVLSLYGAAVFRHAQTSNGGNHNKQEENRGQ